MATTYPTTKQSIPNPTGTDLLENASATLDHDYQHSTENDTIEALQDKVGIDGDPNVDSFDYKLSDIASGEKAVSTDASGQTVTDITLTDPQFNFGSDATGDMYYRNSSGVTDRLPIGTSGQILQTSAGGIPEWIANPAASNASTTVKGVVEEATLAETLARTGTGGTGARTFVSPTNLTTVLTYDYIASATGNDSYAITVAPAPTAYVAGQKFTFKADVANTGTATLNVNSLGAVTIKKNVSDNIETGDIKANSIVTVVYDGTNFQTISGASTNGTLRLTSNTENDVNEWTTVSAIPDADLGWAVNSNSTYVAANGVSYDANTNSYFYNNLLGKAGGNDIVSFSDSGWKFRIKCSFINNNTTTANIRYWFGFTTGGNAQNSSDITETSTHRAGLAWYNGALYLVTCNGSSVTATNIATRAGSVWDIICIEFDGATMKATLNGTEFTTTSTLPTTGTMRILAGGYESGGGSSGFSINSLTISTKYNA